MSKFRFLLYCTISLIIILILGLIHLPVPFGGDQAFFLLGAKEMNEGWVLYKDFWDVKQPGIFYFYYLAGKLFGFNLIGIRLFELIYWTVFLMLCHFFFNKFIYKDKPFQAFLAGTMIVGSYYGLSYYINITQVEILANFPILLLIIFNFLFLFTRKRRFIWLILSGMCFGIILLLKIMFLPIVLLLYFLVLIFWLSQNNLQYKIIIYLFFILLGLFLSISPFAIYCYKHNIIGLCYTTFFEYPPKILENGYHKDVSVLLISIFSFFKKIPLLIPFLILGIIKINRKDFFHLNMLIWLISGLIIIILQRTSWYQYHLYLIYTPVIILSIHGIEYFLNNGKHLPLLGYFKEKWKYVVFFYLLVNLPTISYVLVKVYKLSKFNFCITQKDFLSYTRSNEQNNEAYLIAESLKKADNPTCSIFVVHDPLVYYYTGLNQAISQSGWSLHLFIPSQYELLLTELKAKKPCYIFIHEKFTSYFEINGKLIQDWITLNYIEKIRTKYGSWFKLK